MTSPAVGSEFAVVNIVGAMAVRAVLAEPGLRSQRLPVTAFASNIRVRAVESEVGLCIVIKPPLVPVDRDMALRARCAEASCMRVTVAVAANTFFRGITEYVRLMTFSAFDFRVFAEEWKAGQVVIKKHVVLPGGLVVTINTLCTLRALVGVVLVVASEAVRCQRHRKDWLDVTGDTLRLRMFAS